MITKNTKCLVAFIIASSLAASAYATKPGFYLGLQAGATNLNNPTLPVQTGVSSPATQSVSPSNKGVGERLYMGAGITQYAAVELGYTHYAASTYKTNPSAIVNTPAIRENGIDLSGKAILPIQNFAVFAKLGAIMMFKSYSGAMQPLPPEPSNLKANNNIHPLIGIGASYDITQNWVADLSWTRALKGGNGFQNADFVAIGISYHFVDQFCGQFLC